MVNGKEFGKVEKHKASYEKMNERIHKLIEYKKGVDKH